MRTWHIPRLRAGAALLLLAGGPAALGQEAKQDPAAKLAAIEQEFLEEQKAFQADMQSAPSDEARGQLWEGFTEDVVPGYAQRLAELAREAQGTETAFQAWMRSFQLGSQYQNGEASRRALEALIGGHVEREELGDLAGSLRWGSERIGEEQVIGALRTLAERSPHAKVKGAALFTLGAVLGENRKTGDPELAEARAIFERVRREFGAVESRGGRTYGQAAEDFLFELDHLQVGMQVPDFEAVDVEGARFKLSDYAGKVVLVDFWGFW